MSVRTEALRNVWHGLRSSEVSGVAPLAGSAPQDFVDLAKA